MTGMVTWGRHAWDQDLGSGLWEKGQGLGACDYTYIQMVPEPQKATVSQCQLVLQISDPASNGPLWGLLPKNRFCGVLPNHTLAFLDASIFKLKTYLVCWPEQVRGRLGLTDILSCRAWSSWSSFLHSLSKSSGPGLSF